MHIISIQYIQTLRHIITQTLDRHRHRRRSSSQMNRILIL